MFFYLFILLITLAAIKFIKRCFHFKNRGITAAISVPYFNFVIDLLAKDITKINLYRRNKYGKLYGSWFGLNPIIIVGDPEMAKIITQKEAQNFSDSQFIKLNIKYFKDTFMMKRGKEWKDGRSLFTPVFTTKRIRDIYPSIQKSSTPFFDNINELISQGKQDEIEIKELLKSYSLDVIAKYVFALDLNSHKDKNHPFVVSVKKFANFNQNWKFVLFSVLPESIIKAFDLQFLDVEPMDYVGNLVKFLIKERKEKKETKYNDFLELFLSTIEEKKIDVKDEEIIGLTILFFFAGMETVATTICNVFYALILNPDCQEQLYNELITLYPNKELEYDDLSPNKSPYLDAVIKETQRKYPILSLLFRIAENPTEIKGQKFEKSDIVGIDVYSFHNSPDYWSEPEIFKPERFLNAKDQNENYSFENIVDNENMLFLPFGSGVRSCPATRYAITQVKYCVAKTLLNYSLHRTAKTDVPHKYLQNSVNFVFTSMYLGFRKRNN